MESGKQPIDPSLALINDEILSTQARLMELYVKQAQATAANEAARIQERFQAELTALQTELKQQNLALESQKALFHQAERNLKAGLWARLQGSQRLLEAPETVLGTTKAQALRQRIVQLESTVQKAQLTTEIEAARIRETWQAELAALKAQLERTESPQPVVQTSVDEVEGTLAAEIQDLRSQLAAKVELLEHRAAELQNARTQIALLQQRIQQLELTGAQSEEAVSEGTRLRKTLQAELIALRTAFEQKDLTLQKNHTAATELEQRLNLQLRGLQSQLEEKQGLLETRSQKIGELTTRINDLQEQIARLELATKQTVEQNQSAARALQDGLCAHIQELESTIAEQAQGLQSRTAELETAHSETTGLQQRLQELEAALAQREATASEAARVRKSLQDELVALRRALEQRTASLEQNQAATRELEEHLDAQLRDLQRELAEKQGLAEARSREISDLTAKTSDLQEQITCLELANKQTVKEANTAARALEESLRARIRELEAAVAEKDQGLQSRTVELESAQSETGVLRQRIAELEQTHAEAAEAKNETERAREGLQNELNNVHRALAQKDAWLAQREAEFKESSERLQVQLSDFQNQLTEIQQRLESKDRDLSQAADQISALEKRNAELESLSAEAQAAAGAAAERVRQESQSVLEALQASLREKDQKLQQHHLATAEREANLNSHIEDLRKQISHKQDLLDRRDQESHTLASEMAALHEHIAQLELAASAAEKLAAEEAERIQSDLQAKLSALQAQLDKKDLELAASQSLVQESEGRLQAQIHDLQIQISEKELLLKARNIEVAGLQDKLTALSEELTQVEAGKRAVEAAASDAEITCRRYEEELDARQEKIENLERLLAEGAAESNGLRHTFNAELGDLQRELAEKQGLLDTRSREIGELTTKTSDLQEQITCLELANKQAVTEANTAARALEESLGARIQELEAAVAEKAQGLQNRTRELESAHSESAVLQQRIEQLEQSYARTAEAKNEANRAREGLQNELNNVHRALEQKDAWLAHREAEFKESSERLQAQLSDFQNQLTEKRDALETQANDLLSARSEITELGNRIRELESAKASVETNAITGMDRLREQFQLDLADLRTELEQKELALEERQITIRTLEAKLNSENHRLETLAAEKQALLDRSHLQLEEKGSEITALREELARSEFARRQAAMFATTEGEQIRERVKAEVAALDAQLKEKENALKSLANRGQELELKVDDLRQQLAQKELLIQSRDIEVTDLRTQADDLLAQITHLESAHGAALEQQRVAAGQLEQNLRVQVDELQNQLTERLTLLETRNKEVQALNSKVTELADHLHRSEVTLEQERATAASEMEQIRQQSQSELTAQQEEIERKVEELQDREAALYAGEHSFKDEIDALRTEVAEKRFLLENRTDQLVRVKVEMDELQERIADLESERQAEKEAREKAEQEGERTRIEVDKLWDELSPKGPLEERQVAVNDLNQNFHEPIGNLPIELSEKQVLIENPNRGFLLGDPNLTETQKEKLNQLEQLLETIKADNEKRLISPQNRKWRFSLSRKRRWKS